MTTTHGFCRIIWSGDVVYVDGGSVSQYRSPHLTRVDRKTHIERCNERRLILRCKYADSHLDLSITIVVATIGSSKATLARGKILAARSLEKHVDNEINIFCGSHKDRLMHCCRQPFDADKVCHLMKDFIYRTTNAAGLRFIKVDYKIAPTA